MILNRKGEPKMINENERPIPTTEAELAEMKVAPMGFFSEHWVDVDGNPAGGLII